MDLNAVVQILSHLIVGDNAVRANAESKYIEFKQATNIFPFGLLSVASASHVEESLRQLSIVLLRRSIIEEQESLYNKMETARLARTSTMHSQSL